jgi:hypothetical protein
MPVQLATVTAPSPKPKRNHRKAKRPFDMRTAQGQRVKALTAAFTAKLGDAASDAVVTANIRKAAELTVLAEEASAKALSGKPIDMDIVVRLARASDLAVKRLHLREKPKPAGPSLQDVLREYAEKEAAS